MKQLNIRVDFLDIKKDAIVINTKNKLFIAINNKYKDLDQDKLDLLISKIRGKNVVCIIDDLREYLN